MCQNTTQPDWQHKSRLIQQLARVGVFEHISDAVSRAIISIVENHDK